MMTFEVMSIGVTFRTPSVVNAVTKPGEELDNIWGVVHPEGMASVTTPVEKFDVVVVYVIVQVPEEPAGTSDAGDMTAAPLPGWACAAVEKRIPGRRQTTNRSPFRTLFPGV